MRSIYTAPAFRATAAKAGTDQAETRPLTLTGQGETVKHSLTDAQFDAWANEADAEKRTAILASAKRRVIGTGKVQVTTAALAAWQTAIRAEADAMNAARSAEFVATKEVPVYVPVTYSEHAQSILSGGLVVIEAADEDRTEETLLALFG
jgi:hypothetical protein